MSGSVARPHEAVSFATARNPGCVFLDSGNYLSAQLQGIPLDTREPERHAPVSASAVSETC